MLVTLALVLPSYARRPFWFDELASVEIAGLGPNAFFDYVLRVESNMALYHGVLALWLQLGSDEAWTRLPSIVFALATLPFLFALGRRLFDRTTAALAVALLCVNVSYVGYARDARSYALVLLLVTASSFFLVRAVEDSRPRDWAGWALLSALAVWAHLFAALVLVAQIAWLLLERESVPRRRALAAVGGLAALLLPLALAVVLGGQSAQLDWLGRPGVRQVPGLGEWFVESRATLIVYLVGAVAALVAAVRTRDRGPVRASPALARRAARDCLRPLVRRRSGLPVPILPHVRARAGAARRCRVREDPPAVARHRPRRGRLRAVPADHRELPP